MKGSSQNQNLHNARTGKKDEFYTQITDIEKELRHYEEHFKGKVVFCNCDNPYESNFFKYFILKFVSLGLKKLITTSYSGSSIAYTQLTLEDIIAVEENSKKETIKKTRGISGIVEKPPYKSDLPELSKVFENQPYCLQDIEALLKKKKYTSLLYGDGDFRSKECIELLKQADIVVTNPPFSLFREYVAQLIEYDKKFLIIGNVNAVTYKEIFKLIKENKMWLGVSISSGDREFQVPDSYPLNAAGTRIDEIGNKFIRVKGVRWFTNLDNKKRHEDLVLYKKYNPEEYPKYDNYDAINVNATKDIPCDYEGEMGVPITFLDKYNPDQFEIIGLDNNNDESKYKWGANSINGKTLYRRIIIKKRKTCEKRLPEPKST